MGIWAMMGDGGVFQLFSIDVPLTETDEMGAVSMPRMPTQQVCVCDDGQWWALKRMDAVTGPD